MRAVLIRDGKGPASHLYLGDVEMPKPDHEEVLVKVKAFGVNRMDILQREGHYPLPPGASKDILGVEFSGVITELGTNVERWQVGDEVFGLTPGGAYAEYLVAPQKNIMKKPESLTWVEAASIPENLLTAFQALVLISEVRENDNVLVHAGASGVGVAALQLAHLYKASKVIATTSTQEKVDWLLKLPNAATHGANYKTQDFASVVKEVTDGHGADVVIDFVGQSHFNKNLAAMAKDGRMTMLGLLSGAVATSVDLSQILLKRLRIEGTTLRSRSMSYQANLVSRFEKEVLSHVTSANGNGAVRIYIHKVYPWQDIIEAHNEMESNKNSGKIVIEVTEA
ncbi:hypothetical protein BKA70DRAFT_1280362 [Coprinopsis sp. MPI-PUGE-AT-0042]|nr:hypothetical protein BKA70DRAFT_1280362 [Coprinopsis sp. MPI-PUGE-AT-0042]